MTVQFETQVATAAEVEFASFPKEGVAVVFGAGGGIGGALVEALRFAETFERVVAFSRSTSSPIEPWRRLLGVLATSALAWLIFRLRLRIGRFGPEHYRREIAMNTDYRKFDDGLLMTVDCTPAALQAVRSLLEHSSAQGLVRFGLHVQDAALMTCVVPSVTSSDHMHFIDGAGGGYAAASKQVGD